MKFLLDTNACIALLNGRPVSVRERLGVTIAKGHGIGVPSVVAFELWFGVEKSGRVQQNRSRLETFLSSLAIVPFDSEDALETARIRAELETAGKPIGPFDVLIAGQARRRNCTLVTANTREFARVSGLLWEDWAKS